jgi:hypothetical protein
MSLSAEPHSSQISFGDFRDFFILLSRKVSLAEIYQYYEVRKYMTDGRGDNVEGIQFIRLIRNLLIPFKMISALAQKTNLQIRVHS